MKPLRITYCDGMVSISSDDMSFGYIPRMYQHRRAGIALQVDEHISEQDAKRMCIKISESVIEFMESHRWPINEGKA